MTAGALLLSLIASPSAPALDGPAVAAGLAARAVEGSPDVAALRSKVRALEAASEAARFRTDPMVMAEWSHMPWDAPWPGRHAMSGIGVKLQQKFVRAGKNERREAAAKAAVAPAREAVQALQLTLDGRVRRAYWRLALVRRLRALTGTHIELVGRLQAVAKARYEVGKAGQQDLLRLQLLRGRLTDKLDDFARDERRILASLAAAVGGDLGAPVSTPDLLPDAGAAPAWTGPPDTPGLRRLQAEAAAKRAAAERMAYEAQPDWTAWAGYRLRLAAGMDPGDDFVSVGVGVPLPLDVDGRFEGQAAALRAQAASAERAHAAAIVRLRGVFDTETARLDRAKSKAATYEAALIPKAKETLAATLNAYQTDRADFTSLFQAEIAVIDLEREADKARADALDARIALQTLMGAPTP